MSNGVPGYIITLLDYEHRRACREHPLFPIDSYPIIMEELGEAAQSHNDGDIENEISELAQTMATCARRINNLTKQQK